MAAILPELRLVPCLTAYQPAASRLPGRSWQLSGMNLLGNGSILKFHVSNDKQTDQLVAGDH